MLDLATRFHSRQPSTDRIEWLISSTRVLLVGFSLLAVYFDPFEQPRYSDHVVEILLVYFVIATAVAAAAFVGYTSNVWQGLVHATDILVISLLLYLTQGPLSPFFLFFSFVLFSGTLRWSWRGAAITAMLLLVATGLLAWQTWPASEAFPDEADFELNRILLRVAFLLMSGIMLMWFGYAHEAASGQLSELAAWPGPASAARAEESEASLAPVLAHVAKVMNAPRILIRCQRKDRPGVETWTWTRNSLRHERTSNHVADRLPSASAPAGSVGDLAASGGGRAVLRAEFANDIVEGTICLPDRAAWSADDSAMMEIIAARIGLELEHLQLRADHEIYAALRERERLARDLHDGVVQTLTAARLQLSEIRSADGAKAETVTRNVSLMLQDEQRRLRGFRGQLLNPPSSPVGETTLQQLREEIIGGQQKLWACSVVVAVSPSTASVSNSLATELKLLIGEAIGNAVRHGRATEIQLRIVKEPDRLVLDVSDNGCGLPGAQGEFAMDDLLASGIGPSSLIARTNDLNGTIRLSTTSKGVALRIGVPLSVGAS